MYSNECTLRDCQLKIEKIVRVSNTISWTASDTVAGRELGAYFKCPPQHLRSILSVRRGTWLLVWSWADGVMAILVKLGMIGFDAGIVLAPNKCAAQ